MSPTPTYRADKHRVRRITQDEINMAARTETIAFCDNSTTALMIATALNAFLATQPGILQLRNDQ